MELPRATWEVFATNGILHSGQGKFITAFLTFLGNPDTNEYAEAAVVLQDIKLTVP